MPGVCVAQMWDQEDLPQSRPSSAEVWSAGGLKTDLTLELFHNPPPLYTQTRLSSVSLRTQPHQAPAGVTGARSEILRIVFHCSGGGGLLKQTRFAVDHQQRMFVLKKEALTERFRWGFICKNKFPQLCWIKFSEDFKFQNIVL